MKMKVLICDDTEADLEKIAYILDYSYDFSVKTITFRQPSDALSYIRSGAAVDVCIFETVTPGMNGIELAEQVRNTDYTGEIIFLTASREFGPDSIRLEVLDYLLKPIMPEKMRSAISKAEDKIIRLRGSHAIL